MATMLTGKLRTTVEAGLKAATELQQNAQNEADSFKAIADALQACLDMDNSNTDTSSTSNKAKRDVSDIENW